MPAPRRYNRAQKTKEILERLAKAPVPFLANAAEGCGVHRKTAREWFRLGTEDPEHELAEFAIEVKRIQADWQDQKLAEICGVVDKNTNMRAQQLTWIMQRLDREQYDPPKTVANVVKSIALPGEEANPLPPDEQDVAKAAEALGKTVN